MLSLRALELQARPAEKFDEKQIDFVKMQSKNLLRPCVFTRGILSLIVCLLLPTLASSVNLAGNGAGNGSGSGDLFLTPFVNSGRLEEGRNASLVTGLPGVNLTSYSGFFTVDDCRSHYFFWFFPAQTHADSAPVLLWLQGGPGLSSMQGLLYEHGPIGIRKPNQAHKDINKGPKLDIELDEREVFLRDLTWNKEFSMLYVDNPLGAGYSYSEDLSQQDDQSREDYTRRLYSTVTQFFQLFPDFANRDFYIGGQSYAGKYVPSLAHHIHEMNSMNSAAELDVNLKGIYLGAGFCHPETMIVSIADYIYTWGGYTKHERDSMKQQSQDAIQETLANGTNMSKHDIIRSFWGSFPRLQFDRSWDNMLDGIYVDGHGIRKFAELQVVKRALHVADRPNASPRELVAHDLILSTKPSMSVLLDNYKVLFYNGNLDLVVNTMGVEDFFLSTPWSGLEEYRTANRSNWCSSDTVDLNLIRAKSLLGFYTRVGNFCRVIVHNAGHQTPHDQPVASLQMIRDFVHHGCLQPPDGQDDFQCSRRRRN